MPDRQITDFEDVINDLVKRMQRQERRTGTALGTITGEGQTVKAPTPSNSTGSLPTEGPISSPSIQVVGDADGLVLVATDFAPTSVLDVYLDGVLIIEGTSSTVIRLLASEYGLLEDTDYTFHVVARNVVDSAPPSESVTARLNSGVTAEVIIPLLNTALLRGDTIQLGNRITISVLDGIVVNHDNATQTRIPADGSGPHFAGTAEFTTVVTEFLRIIGQVSIIESALEMASGVAAPTTAARLNKSWTHPEAFSQCVYASDRWHGLFGEDFSPFFKTWTSAWSSSAIYSYYEDPAEGPANPMSLPTYFYPGGGVTMLEDENGDLLTYVLGQDSNRGNQWYVYVFSPSTNKIAEFPFAHGTPIGNPAIGNNGVDLLIGYQLTSTGMLRVSNYGTDGTFHRYDAMSTAPANTDVRGVYQGGADFGTTRFVLALPTAVRVYNDGGGASGTAQTRITAQEWLPANGEEILGLFWDGVRWHSLGPSGKVWHYSRRPVAETRTVTYSWYDSDPGPAFPDPDSGTHETEPGAPATYTFPARTWPLVETDRPNDGGGPSDPDSVRIYVDNHRQPELAPGITMVAYDTFDLAGLNGRTDNQFADLAGSIGEFRSAAADGLGKLISLLGNGEWRLGHLAGNADGTNANDTGWVNVTLGTGYAHDGTEPGQVRTIDGWTTFRGRIKRTSGTGTSVASVTTGHRPTADIRTMVRQGSGMLPFSITTAGTLAISASVVSTTEIELGSICGIPYRHN